MTIDALTTFFGWMTTINFGILVFSAVLITFAKEKILKTHKLFFTLSDNEFEAAYFRYIANYKLAFVILNLVPYFSLLLIS